MPTAPRLLLSVACAIIALFIMTSGQGVTASPPDTGAGECNHALVTNGATATGSSQLAGHEASKAIDASISTWWESAATTGYLTVTFPEPEYIDEAHVHFRTAIRNFDLYSDANGDGLYGATEKVRSALGNTATSYVAALPAHWSKGLKFDMPSAQCISFHGNLICTRPNIGEFEAYLRYDSDGDGLTNTYETTNLYYQKPEMLGSLPILDGGAAPTTYEFALSPWQGIVNSAFVNFTVSHPTVEDLTVELGYLDGSTWVDRYLWDPGGHAVLPETVLTPSGVVGGTIPVTTTVTNGIPLSRVDFYFDGGLVQTDSTPSDGYFWTWDTSTTSEGVHSLESLAFDVGGNQVLRETQVTVDNTAPTASILQPVDGGSAYGYIETTVAASDANGIGHVTFYVDGVAKASVSSRGTDGYYHWTWDARSVPGGSQHTIRAVAVDPAGNLAVDEVLLTVGYNTPPSISIALPYDGSTITGLTRVVVSASDADGIAVVTFYLGDDWDWQYSDYSSPYSWTFDTTTVNDGLTTIVATAIDEEGGYAFDAISVYVNNGGGDPICKVPPCPMSVEPLQAPPTGTELASPLDTGVWLEGSNHVAQIDIRKGARGLTSAEEAAGLLGPAFSDADLHGRSYWRLVIRDWSAGGSGTLTAFYLKVLESSDPLVPDTDGDGLTDGEESLEYGTYPTTRDTDGDTLEDDQELWTYGTSPLRADTDADGLSDNDELTRMIPVLSSSYETHEDGWTTPPDELVEWHRDSGGVSHSPSFSYHVSRHASLSWSSRLESPLIRLPSSQRVEVSFWSYSRFMQFDMGEFRIRGEGAGYETTLATLTSYDPQSVWNRVSADISAYAAQDVTFAFVFSSTPGEASSWPGWFIDDVRLTGNANPLLSDTDSDLVTDSMEGTLHQAAAYDFDWGARDWDVGGLWQAVYPDSSPEDGMGQALAVGRDPSFSTYNYLTSPRLFLPLSPTVKLRYDVLLSLDWRDSVEVRIRTDNGGSPDSVAFFTLSDPQATWFSDTVDLSAYAGRAIFLEFFAYSAAGGLPGPWAIDDVTLEADTNPLLPDTDLDGLGDGAEPLSSPVSADSDMDGIGDDYDPRPNVEDDPPLLRIEFSQGSNSVAATIWVTEFSGWSVTLARAHYYLQGTIDEWRDADVLSENPYCCAWVQFLADPVWHILPEEYEVEITDSNGNKARFWVDVDAYGVPKSLRLQLERLGPLPLLVLATATGEAVFSLPMPWVVIGLVLLGGGILVVARVYQGTTQEAYPGAPDNPIEVYHDPIFRGEIPLNTGNEGYGWTHIKNDHSDLWTKPELGIVDPNSDSATQDQQVRDRIREVIESPSTILNSDASRKTMYFRDYLKTDGKCYWFIVIVGLDGVLSAYVTTRREYLQDQLTNFPQEIKPELPFDPACRALS